MYIVKCSDDIFRFCIFRVHQNHIYRKDIVSIWRIIIELSLIHICRSKKKRAPLKSNYSILQEDYKMNETKRNLLGQLTMSKQLGCVQCALELGREVPMTFYQAFCEGCCKNQDAIIMNDGLRAFQSMGVCEQAENLETMKRRIAVLLEQYEVSLQLYGKKVQESLKRKEEAQGYERVEA